MNAPPVRPNPLRAALSTALLSVGIAGEAAAAQKMPSVEELWKVIQQQQQEIEALKTKLGQTETVQKEVKQEVQDLKTASKGEAPSEPGKPADEAGKKKVKSESDRKTDILAAEVEKLKTSLIIPEKREYKSMYGMAPAASQVYMNKRGLSIGGYGEFFYTNFQNDGVEKSLQQKNTADMARLVLYAGYKFNDWIVLNNEIEFEHGSTGEGSEEKGEVSVEFSYLDFLFDPRANVRTGLMLVPMGFINEIHEPTFFHGNRRPEVEQLIIPTTWREMGVGVHGEIVPGLVYRAYGINGLNAEGFDSFGIREGRQGGSQALAENLAFTGRVDYMPPELPGLMVGASTFLGDAGQGNVFMTAAGPQKPNVFTQLYEGHLQWHYRGFEFRALGAWGGIGDAAILSEAKGETVGSSNYGWYVEGAYDVLPWLWQGTTQYLAPFVRYQRYNTLATVPDGFTDYDGLYDRRIYQAGLTYKPITNIVIKADYQNISSGAGQLPGQFNLGVGFIY
ncbi:MULTISPECIES: hypothetical protein [unclassified Methylococcus]|uniref:hypothetical protein n=1 Tax=unclassified Methylococcus TaxID=2618889 RepID=UPI003D7CF23E